jgi:hypothetical protein
VLARVGDYSWPPPSDCEGFLCLSKGNSSGLCVACVIPILYWLCGTRLWDRSVKGRDDGLEEGEYSFLKLNRVG